MPKTYDIDVFLAEFGANPRRGYKPLGVQFFDGSPYDIIIETTDSFYIIVNDDLSPNIIVETVT